MCDIFQFPAQLLSPCLCIINWMVSMVFSARQKTTMTFIIVFLYKAQPLLTKTNGCL